MGCLFSSSRNRRSSGLDEDSDSMAMLVFWPGLRIPSVVQTSNDSETEVPEQILLIRSRVRTSADALYAEITDNSSKSASQPGSSQFLINPVFF